MPLPRLALLAAATLALAACSGAPPASEMPAPDPMPEPMPEMEPAPDPMAEAAQAGLTFDPDTVRAGRFDNGRMFTLDDLPVDYLEETYGVRPDADWSEHARLGALRFATYCSASFVSDAGLVLTNHHCARESITKASLEDGADYNADGYFAREAGQEKPIEGLFVEQLVSIEDVTAEIEGAVLDATTDAERVQARAAAISAMEDAGEDETAGTRMEVVTLYSGGQYKAYTYKRFDDVRMVFAPETLVGYFGGDPDNFTYPRYSLDFALFRVYDADGEPYEPEQHFAFEPDGTVPGEVVFVIGNPGSTTRLQTVAELEYRRDVTEPALLNFIASREAAYGDFLAANPDAPRFAELEDTYFSLGNGRKAYTGRVGGLRDPYVIARRAAAERDYQAALAENADAQATYGDVIDRIAENRQRARALAPRVRAFTALGPGSPYNGTALNRGFVAVMNGGDGLEEALAEVEDQPVALQIGLLTARLRDLQAALGDDDPLVQTLLGGRTPEGAAANAVQTSALATERGARAAAAEDLSADPAVQMAQTMLTALQGYFGEIRPLNAELGELQAQLARGRFEVYGTAVPPDATFTLRISDGVVKGYPYNGTIAPPYTTFFGLYDRWASHCMAGDMGASDDGCDWALPQTWIDARDELDLSTPYNFVSTNDIIGGNSGSPVLNADLEVVGIAFDGNIQSLPGNYIFDDRLNRTVSLDVRAMIESLAEVYEMDRIVDELTD